NKRFPLSCGRGVFRYRQHIRSEAPAGVPAFSFKTDRYQARREQKDQLTNEGRKVGKLDAAAAGVRLFQEARPHLIRAQRQEVGHHTRRGLYCARDEIIQLVHARKNGRGTGTGGLADADAAPALGSGRG
ncbi:MAG TPA: hypothetical protein PK417_09715, partial [Hyphomonas sp.]|nr:hypothetical protein [Hyphomonas sp.]